jgi:hypothetical protein
LTLALKAWLDKVQEEGTACEANLKSFRTPAFSWRSYPFEGKLVIAHFMHQRRLYEFEWQAAYKGGKTPDLVPVRCFTKEMLAAI